MDSSNNFKKTISNIISENESLIEGGMEVFRRLGIVDLFTFIESVMATNSDKKDDEKVIADALIRIAKVGFHKESGGYLGSFNNFLVQSYIEEGYCCLSITASCGYTRIGDRYWNTKECRTIIAVLQGGEVFIYRVDDLDKGIVFDKNASRDNVVDGVIKYILS